MSQTQQQQMIVMLAGLFIAAVLIVWRLPEGVSLTAAFKLAGALDRMNVVSFELDFDSRYNFWSGIAGGFFLALAYFGTDQSQVQRYLSGAPSPRAAGLLFNGIFRFHAVVTDARGGVRSPLHAGAIFFNTPRARRGEQARTAMRCALQGRYEQALAVQREPATAYVAALEAPDGTRAAARDALRAAAAEADRLRAEAKTLVARAMPDAETKDSDYVFIGFVLRYVPTGLVGLLIAVILCAAMSSTSSELAALGTTTNRRSVQTPVGTAPIRRATISSCLTLHRAVGGAVAPGQLRRFTPAARQPDRGGEPSLG